ncbi:MAG: ribonuclease P protein component [Candidatus Pacebacteria bacterium]|nr:ribonuclease P protein component [Candidatus Paceibacterota bacterium]
MLKKEFRLRKQKDFENVFNKGVYFSEKFLVLKISENSLSFSRFGFIVSKKVSKRAVDRNRVKRLMSESIRLSQKKIKSGFDVVFITRGGIIDKSFEEVKGSVEKLLKRSGLLEK